MKKNTMSDLKRLEIRNLGDINKDIYELINGFFQRSQMYYDEWFPMMKRSNDSSKELTDAGGWPKEDSDYYLMKAEFERIMRERERMPDDELIKYIDGIFIGKRRPIYIYMLLIYLDFYSEDENFEKELWDETMKYFEVTDQEIKNFRI